MKKKALLIISMLLAVLVGRSPANAPVVIVAEGEYVMGAGETMEAAEERARKAAMQSAAEKAGAFVKSYTRANNLTLESDVIEVIADHSMKVEVLERKKIAIGDLDGIKFRVKIKAVMTEEEVEANLKKVRNDRGVVEAYNRIKNEYEKQAKELESLKVRLEQATGNDKQRIAGMISEEEKKFRANLWIEKAEQKYEFEYDAIMKAYAKALELNPDSAAAHAGMARNLYAMANYLYPSVIDAQDLSKAEEKAAKLRDALRHIDKAVSLDDTYGRAYEVRAEVLALLRDTERAIHRVKAGRGDFTGKKQEYDRRILEDINRAIMLSGSSGPDPYRKRAKWHLHAADDAVIAEAHGGQVERHYADALADIDQAITLCREDQDCLGGCYGIKGNIYQSRRWYYLRNGDKAKADEAGELAERWYKEARSIEEARHAKAVKEEERNFALFENTEMGKLEHELSEGLRERALGHPLPGGDRQAYELAVKKIKKRINSGTASAEDYIFMAFHDLDNLEQYFEKGVSLFEKRRPKGREALQLVQLYLESEFYQDRGKDDVVLKHLDKAKTVIAGHLPQAQKVLSISDYRRMEQLRNADAAAWLTAVSGLRREGAEAFYWLFFAAQTSKMRAEIYERMRVDSRAREEYRFLCNDLQDAAACKDAERLR